MKLVALIVFSIAVCSNVQLEQPENNTLKLLHVLFRHGNRKSIYVWSYENETFEYNNDELTKRGKENSYLLGKWLQDRYGQFLGTYSSDSVESASTFYERAQSTMQLVLQGLYSPKAIKERALDQVKFKTTHLPLNTTVLVVPSLQCKNYITHYKNQMNSEIYHNALKKYVALNDYLKTNANKTFSTLTDVLLLSDSIIVKKELGVNLPQWSETIQPLIENSTLDYFLITTATKELNQILIGGFIKNVIENSRLKFKDQLEPKNRKLFIYAGHDLNVFCILRLFDNIIKERPPYNSCVMIEAHTIDNVDGFKVFYKSGTSDEVRPIVITGCGLFCPLTKFTELYEEYYPISDAC